MRYITIIAILFFMVSGCGGAESSTPEQYVVELAAFGSGAQTELNSY